MKRLRRTVSASLLGLFLVAAHSPGGINHWTRNGPEGGAVYALGVDPQDPFRVYGWGVAGFFRSDDGGSTGHSLGGLLDIFVSRLVVDPFSPGTVYAATSTGVAVSRDAGRSWFAAGLSGGPVHDLAVDPVNRGVLYAAVDAGVLKSPDGGQTWTPINTGLETNASPSGFLSVNALAVDPGTPSTLYAATNGGGVFKSVDAGAHWSAASVGLGASLFTRLLRVDPHQPSTLFVSAGNALFKSEDGGQNWTPAGLAFVIDLAFDPQTPGTVYAAANEGVVKSADGGATWIPVNTGLPTTSLEVLAAGAATPPALYVGTLFLGAFKTTDGGAHWVPVSLGSDAEPIGTLAVNSSDSPTVYAGNSLGGGVFRSTNGGETWHLAAGDLASPFVNALAADPSSPSTVYAATAQGVWKSVDRGGRWEPVNSGIGNVPIFSLAIDPQIPQTLHAGAAGVAFVSVDGGASWSAHGDGLPAAPIIALVVDPIHSETVFAGTRGAGLFVSHDGGADWQESGAGMTDTTIAILVADGGVRGSFFAGTQGRGGLSNASDALYRSVDGGRTWHPSNRGIEGRFISGVAIDPADGKTMYASSFSFAVPTEIPAPPTDGVYRSVDRGETWEVFNRGLGDLSVFAFGIDSSGKTLHAGTGTGVFDLEIRPCASGGLCPEPPPSTRRQVRSLTPR